ncbi:MAG: hypothetical protein ACREEE_10790 [Dongiaceae bacterium]
MKPTDPAWAEMMQRTTPNTFRALEQLVPALAATGRYRGKSFLFGRGAQHKAAAQVEAKLKETLLAMVQDRLIERHQDAETCRQRLVAAVRDFASAYQDQEQAYALADEYLVGNAADAKKRIREFMK